MTLTEKFQAAHAGLAVGPIQPRTLLHLAGKDAAAYLHRMTTQEVKGLPPGGATWFALLTPRGHLVGEGALRRLDDGLLLDVDPAAAAEVQALLQKMIFRDAVTLSDRTEAWRILPLLGPGAAAAAEAKAPDLAGWAHGRRGAPALDLLVPAGRSGALRAALVAAGATPLEEQDLDALRVAGGIGRWGAELVPARLPMEAGLTADAISFKKGCYPGQEVVVRGSVRGQIQRGLVLLDLPAGAGPGSRLRSGEAEVGEITSAAETPAGRRGLGYLKRSAWPVGTRLATDGGEAQVLRAVAGDQEPERTAPRPSLLGPGRPTSS